MNYLLDKQLTLAEKGALLVLLTRFPTRKVESGTAKNELISSSQTLSYAAKSLLASLKSKGFIQEITLRNADSACIIGRLYLLFDDSTNNTIAYSYGIIYEDKKITLVQKEPATQ